MEKKFRSIVRKDVLIAVLAATSVFVLAEILSPLQDLLMILLENLFGSVSVEIFLRLIISLFLVLSFLLSYIGYLLNKLSRRKTFLFNIFWDKQNKPRCPYCRGKFISNAEIPQCSKCKEIIPVGELRQNTPYNTFDFLQMTLEEAIEKKQHLDNDKNSFTGY